MPTAVENARQCLTAEAAAALDEAAAAARRRGHSQTTSLHMVSSLLSLPSSALREACSSAARSGACSTRVLELCLGVSLDRLPRSANRTENDPPVSNSLMAAIKRSQANQRRQPENFNFYQQQQQQQQSSSVSAPVVKVELQNLVVSILDDPAVSRVFGEAGFRSCDLKIAILTPVHHHFFKYSSMYNYNYNYKSPPLFLCNLPNDSELRRRSFSFPFLNYDGDQNCRRVFDVMLKNKQRNPMLVGVCAHNALRSFLEIVQRGGGGVLPQELSGLSVISLETELSRFVNGDCDEDMLRLKFEEVKRMVEQCIGPGVVVSFGDLKVLSGDHVSVEALHLVIRGLGELIKSCSGKIWLIGAVARYEVYLKFLNRFPSIEKDWDLQLLTITSPGPFVRESYPKSSLMESFVPFGGLFTTNDINSPLSSSYPNASRRCLCSEKCRQEINALSSGRLCSSAADHYQNSSLPSWLQSSRRIESMKNPHFVATSSVQAEDDNVFLNAKVVGLQRKWDSGCRNLHYDQPFSTARLDSHRVPSVLGFQVVKESNKETVVNNDRHVPSNPLSKESSPLGVLSASNSVNFLFISPSKSNDELVLESSRSSESLVITDLALQVHSNSPKDFKVLYNSLAERVWWQEEAVRVVSQRIGMTAERQNRRFWFHFNGPDRFGKKKLVIAISEILHGTTRNLICVDLSFGGSRSLFDLHYLNKYDVKIRGKNIVDYIAEKVLETPLSVVFLENIERADSVVQQSLFQAIKTGKISDSHGREVSISNAIFVTATASEEGEKTTEEDIIAAIGWKIEIQIGVDLGDRANSKPVLVNKRKTIGSRDNTEPISSTDMAKRAHRDSNPWLDLNQPADDSEITETDPADNLGPDTTAWFKDFLSRVDGTVSFKPFGFGALAERMVKDIERCFRKSIVIPECSLEIESKVIEHILAAASLTSTKNVEDWIQCVLSKGFIEAQEKYSLTAHSVVKLIVNGRFSEEQNLGAILPGKIMMN